MSTKNRRLALFLALLLFCTTLAVPFAAASGEGEITILFTHDLHSHLQSVGTQSGGSSGGFARLATALRAQRAAHGATITVDAGDFSMGTLFQTIYTTDASELRLLGALGYDAATFGNHEYDFRAAGFASMLQAAAASGDRLPALVEANYAPAPDDLSADAEAVRAAYEAAGVKDYTIIEAGSYRVAVFGLIGVDADECAPKSGMALTAPIDAAERVVSEIQENETCDLIVCLSHSGTWEEQDKSEDELLAKAVPEIDVIVSGHTHTLLTEPIRVGDTLIVSAGEYASHLGALTLARTEDGWEKRGYELVALDGAVPEDAETAAEIEGYKRLVEEEYLSHYGLGFDEVLARTDFDFIAPSSLGKEHREEPLGNLIADAYVFAIAQAEGEDYVPVDVAVEPVGVIRGSFVRGEITTADAFNVCSLGVGKDGRSGYPLLTVYLTGAELRAMAEVDASVTPIMPEAQLYFSGMTMTFNPYRMFFDKVTDAALLRTDGTREEIEDGKLYRVACELYSAQMLGAVSSKTYGLLSLTPKDKNGDPITDFESQIVYDGERNEVKAWYALASYLQSFPQQDGFAEVPLRYAAAEGRKTVAPSLTPVDLLRGSGPVTWAALGAGLLVLVLLVFLVRFAATSKKRRAR
ncbi:MAG TPA: bifunctional UDP-sugar hydrolase/5'-nucleotidase, partial [Oscillospiraceae bacterium]|nr:bifunctional UDP-sugar hydrolase/5'-nucleotidase [Oscillospiraceae bacterium]